jgi:hypothetical protein
VGERRAAGMDAGGTEYKPMGFLGSVIHWVSKPIHQYLHRSQVGSHALGIVHDKGQQHSGQQGLLPVCKSLLLSS